MQSAFFDSAAPRAWSEEPVSSGGGRAAPAPSEEASTEQRAPTIGAGYGARSGNGAKALAITLGLHAAALIALASAGYSAMEREPPSVLQTFDMRPETSPPPPPPPEELVVPENVPAVKKIVAPPVDIQVPTFNKIQTSPEPPEEVKVAAIPVAVSNAPAVDPAPPAPIVPPDFNAGQLNNPGPAYPYLSKKAHEEGVVMLKVLVGTNGRAKSVTVNRSSGHSRLDSAALGAVKKWRFLPATQAGKPVEAWVLVPVTFNLDS